MGDLRAPRAYPPTPFPGLASGSGGYLPTYAARVSYLPTLFGVLQTVTVEFWPRQLESTEQWIERQRTPAASFGSRRIPPEADHSTGRSVGRKRKAENALCEAVTGNSKVGTAAKLAPSSEKSI